MKNLGLGWLITGFVLSFFSIQGEYMPRMALVGFIFICVWVACLYPIDVGIRLIESFGKKLKMEELCVGLTMVGTGACLYVTGKWMIKAAEQILEVPLKYGKYNDQPFAFLFDTYIFPVVAVIFLFSLLKNHTLGHEVR